MKYFVVNTTFRDGEYEYLQQSPVAAETEAEAIAIQEKDAEDWTKDDYREYEIDIRSEITEEEFNIISKYIY